MLLMDRFDLYLEEKHLWHANILKYDLDYNLDCQGQVFEIYKNAITLLLVYTSTKEHLWQNLHVEYFKI